MLKAKDFWPAKSDQGSQINRSHRWGFLYLQLITNEN